MARRHCFRKYWNIPKKKEYIIHLIKLLGKQIDSTLAQLGKTSIDSLTRDVIFGNDTYNYRDN